jgi:hypothetical protein
MPRLRLLLVAVAIGAVGYLYLTKGASLARDQIEASAGDRLLAGQPAVGQHLAQANAAAIATARQVASNEAIAQSMDEHGRPSAEALEVALAALHRAQPLEAERPALLALFGGGAAGRYRLGQSNRFDPDQSAFVALGESGGPAHSVVATLEGQTYRIAVASFDDPKAGGHGLVALGYPLDDAYAKTLAQGSGVEVVLITAGKVVGSSLSPLERGDLSTRGISNKDSFGFGDLSGDHFVVTELVPQLAHYLRLPIGTRGSRYLGRAQPLSALLEPTLGKSPEKPVATEGGTEVVLAVRTLDAYGLLADEQKMFLAGLAFLVLLTLILAATTSNPAKGLDRVAVASEKMVLEGGEIRAPTDHMSRIARRLAIAVNTLAGRLEAAPTPAVPATASRTISQELSAAPSARQTEPPPAAGPAAASAPSVDAFLANKPSDTDPFGRPLTDRPSPAPAGRSITAIWGGPENAPSSDQTVIAPMPEALIRATTRQTSSAPSSFQESAPASPPRSVTGTTPAPSSGGDEAHFQQIYREFVSTRERCGEAADGLSFEKFAAKLKKNQEQLIAKYSCRSVRFQVYVKDGKAALKATPVR